MCPKRLFSIMLLSSIVSFKSVLFNGTVLYSPLWIGKSLDDFGDVMKASLPAIGLGSRPKFKSLNSKLVLWNSI